MFSPEERNEEILLKYTFDSQENGSFSLRYLKKRGENIYNQIGSIF